MSSFESYSQYYDRLYRDKDYPGETAYVMALLRRHDPGADSVLDLGCGTGLHAVQLAENGFDVHGLDRSETMLELARKRSDARSELPLTFSLGDVRSARLDRRFSAVVSLFHVINYQTTNADVLASLATAHEHLSPGGAFLFDCWYGPAVLANPPAVRIKRWNDAEVSITRMSEPILDPNRNMVDVHFTIHVVDLASERLTEIRETHRLRYFFLPELELLLERSGFTLVHSAEWMTGAAPGTHTFSVCLVGQRQ